jgi:hypothetical protein
MPGNSWKHRPPLLRLLNKIAIGDGCWLWIGRTQQDGYGQMLIEGKHVVVHRVAYEALVGPIPEGMDLHHTCEAKSCVRPSHMELVPHPLHKAKHAKSHCKRGHPLTPENVYRTRCRICSNESKRRYKRRQAVKD